jgi:hypothetical protein
MPGLTVAGQLWNAGNVTDADCRLGVMAGVSAQPLIKVKGVEMNDKVNELVEWVDIPTESGEYWVSPFVEGRYVSPRILTVIDYQRPDRGLEVQYDFPHDTIPVKTFTEEYYPNAKWMLIKKPALPLAEALKEMEAKS